ncbi:ZF-HD homeobox protein [Apostasia shenzhenica]|uniref:ZF-HD homeobox protein n=1 Tax=Apostasia shenzhenica TaxID=1088818 RepID=A0A2I0AKP8_9ASPA|nr:ZF-HD homeobox protein [Apostasia shenzhenica]
MDFRDHGDSDEEMRIPNFDLAPAMGNSVRSKPAGGGLDLAGCSNSKNSTGSRYRECLKNHAVGIGGYAVDGCGEFMAAGEDGSMDALRCAACSCHRNFHRKELAGGDQLTSPLLPFSPYFRTPVGHLHRRRTPYLALPSTSGGERSRGEEEPSSLFGFAGISGGAVRPSPAMRRKRFRTKFTAEQKSKMLAFAEKVGWRIQKHDEPAVRQFCDEASINRHALKVWMHNNKHTLGKKP